MDNKKEFLRCPRCGGKTRTLVGHDTMLKNFPLFCPKCRYECMIDFENNILKVIKTPDA